MSYQMWVGMGNLTRDPEMKYVKETAKTSFSIAINEKRGDREEVIFVDVECWDGEYSKLASNVAEYKRKGDQVLVQGRWKMDEWEDQEGQKKRKWYVRADQVRFVGAPRDDDRGSRRDRDDDRPRRRDDRDERPRRRDDRDDDRRREEDAKRYDDLPF